MMTGAPLIGAPLINLKKYCHRLCRDDVYAVQAMHFSSRWICSMQGLQCRRGCRGFCSASCL